MRIFDQDSLRSTDQLERIMFQLGATAELIDGEEIPSGLHMLSAPDHRIGDKPRWFGFHEVDLAKEAAGVFQETSDNQAAFEGITGPRFDVYEDGSLKVVPEFVPDENQGIQASLILRGDIQTYPFTMSSNWKEVTAQIVAIAQQCGGMLVQDPNSLPDQWCKGQVYFGDKMIDGTFAFDSPASFKSFTNSLAMSSGQMVAGQLI